MASVSVVPTARKVNGKPLSADVTLAAADIGALSKPTTPSTDQMVVLKSDGTTTTQAIPSGPASVTTGTIDSSAWKAKLS